MGQKLKKLDREAIQQLELQTAKDLKLDVKNIKYFSGHDGMQGINADIYYEGKKFAHAYDDAHGGCMDVRPIGYDNDNLQIYKDIENKLKALPKYISCITTDLSGKPIGGKPFSYESQVDLASIVDAIAQKKEELKEAKKGIQYTKPDGDYIAHWNMSIPALLKKYPTKAISTIQKRYDGLVAKNYTIRNKAYLSAIGIQV